jgi:hypothetical protein
MIREWGLPVGLDSERKFGDVDPMASPAAVSARGEPYSIDVLAEDGEFTIPRDAPALVLPAEPMLVVYKPGEVPISAPLEDVALVAFRGLHLAVAADRAGADRLGELAPTVGAAPLHSSFAWTYPLVRALDEYAMLLELSQVSEERINPDAPPEARALRFGGRTASEPHGYPVWDGVPDNDIVPGTEQWPTEPLLLPALNLSLGPSSVRFPIDPGDAVQAATSFLSRASFVSAAAGNSGEISGLTTVSAWAQVPWVVAVGATDSEDGGALLSRSSRGLPDQPGTGPDVVAYGASALNPSVRGTSFAAPRVACCAVLATAALLFLRHLAQRTAGGPVEGIRLLGMCCADRFGSPPWYVGPPRLPIGVLPDLSQFTASNNALEVFKRLHTSNWDGQLRLGPQLARNLVKQSARPLEGYAEYQQGAGFVSETGMRDLLAQLNAQRWLELLGLQAHAQSLPSNLRSEPMFSTAAIDQLHTVVRSSMQLVMIDWPTGRWQFRPDPGETEGEA